MHNSKDLSARIAKLSFSLKASSFEQRKRRLNTYQNLALYKSFSFLIENYVNDTDNSRHKVSNQSPLRKISLTFWFANPLEGFLVFQ